MSAAARLLLVMLLATAAKPAPAPQEDARITVQSGLDRPAIWVADRLTYTIDIACPRGVDILVADLAREKLTLTGLEVVGTDSVRRVDADGVTRYAFHYVLTTYRVDVATPAIGPLTVRHYVARAGQGPETASPAGVVLVPGAVVAFRSLLPDEQPMYEVRDARAAGPRWLPYRLLAPVGIGLLLMSAAPVVFLVLRLAGVARARRRTDPRRSSRQVRRATRAALDAIGAAEPSTAEARRDAFARLDGLVRAHVAEVCGVPASGLTPDEIADAIEPCAARLPRELVTSVLAACELARYATPELQPSADAWRNALAQAEQLLSTGR